MGGDVLGITAHRLFYLFMASLQEKDLALLWGEKYDVNIILCFRRAGIYRRQHTRNMSCRTRVANT